MGTRMLTPDQKLTRELLSEEPCELSQKSCNPGWNMDLILSLKSRASSTLAHRHQWRSSRLPQLATWPKFSGTVRGWSSWLTICSVVTISMATTMPQNYNTGWNHSDFKLRGGIIQILKLQISDTYYQVTSLKK